MKIRAETLHDYTAIDDVHIRAFDERIGVAIIVSLHRQRPVFDPDLSLVAEIDGRVVGHVLFSPHTIRLLGQDIRVVNLSPVGIDPAYQRQGVGGALIRQGHEIARDKGYELSFVLGHPPYYPRFGYITHVYGSSSIEGVPTVETPLEVRKPTEADIPLLIHLWRSEEGEVDFAILPGDRLTDWISPNPLIQAAVYVRGGEIVGYSRVHRDEPFSPRVFLAVDTDAARRMVAMIAGETRSTVTLPLHPHSASAPAFGTPRANAWDAGMARTLNPSRFDDFLAQLQHGQRPPGRPVWPVAFDLA
jgi:putative acetyltransferase